MLTLLERRRNTHLLGGSELHALLSLAINPIRHVVCDMIWVVVMKASCESYG